MLRLHQVINGSSTFDKSRYLINALVHSLIPHTLGSIEFPCFRVKGQFQGQRQCIGIVTGMRSGMSHRTLILHSPLFQALCSKPGRSDRHIEHFGNGGADSPFIRDCIAQCHIIGHNTSLTVSRISQIVEPGFPGQRMRILNSVAYGIDVFDRSLQMLIHPDAARLAQFQTGLLRQPRCRTHADRKQYHIGRNRFPTFQKDGNSLFIAPEVRDSFFQVKGDSFLN